MKNNRYITNHPACVAKTVPASLRACRDWIDVELWLRSHSAIYLIRDAALTAAVLCMGIVEVTGSNPVCSTTIQKTFSKEKVFCIMHGFQRQKQMVCYVIYPHYLFSITKAIVSQSSVYAAPATSPYIPHTSKPAACVSACSFCGV